MSRKSTNDNLGASQFKINRGNVWVEDKMVDKCQLCKKSVGRTFLNPLNGKHHCRNCGNIFCDTCSSNYIVIPSFITDKPAAEDFWNLSHYFNSLKKEKERVCNKCHDLIFEKTKAQEKIISILTNPRSIDEIRNLNDSDTEVKDHYYDHFRNIQYYFPNHIYSDIDKKMLAMNAQFFSKHSKYLMHYIKSVFSDNKIDSNNNNNNNNKNNDDDPSETMMMMKIINSDKNKTCNELYCTRNCQEHLSCDDCINILYSCVDNIPDQLIEYLFVIIKKTPEDVLLCHLSFFTNLIKNNKQNKLLAKLVFNILGSTLTMQYQTFWFLNNARDLASLEELRNIDQFISLFDPNQVRIMHQEYTFYTGLIDHLDDPKRYLNNAFNKCNPISLPYDPHTKLTGVDLNGITIGTSYTKPVLIPFETTDGKTTILFKKESIMNDVVVLNLMTLCDIILKDHLDKNFDVVIYPVMPLSNNSGMIEIIDDAETVYEITQRRKKSILQHIVEMNDNGKTLISDALDRYMYSLVSYTLHSYFLGLGDRHLQNIMITNDGAIFHIDFGFILGRDACPFTAGDIKLNSDMLQMIGADGKRCDTYFNLSAGGLTLIRKQFNMFFILLTQDTKFNKEDIEKFVMSRFQPRKNDSHLISELHTVIRKSHKALGDAFRDYWHFYTQETFRNGAGISNIIKSAYTLVKKLTNSK